MSALDKGHGLPNSRDLLSRPEQCPICVVLAFLLASALFAAVMWFGIATIWWLESVL